jgi:hypothetical protein
VPVPPPITRASGKKKIVIARYVHNDRLIDALMTQAFSALNRLQERSARFREFDAALYYRLANDELEAVARELTDALKITTSTRWLFRLTAVSRAPRRISNTLAPEQAAKQRLTDSVTGTEPFDTVMNVLVRLWIASDPLCGSERAALHRQFKGGLEMLKEHLGDGDSALQAAVDHYEELAHRWTRTPHLRPTLEERQ